MNDLALSSVEDHQIGGYIQNGQNGFASVTLPLKDGFEYSVKLG